MCSNRPFEGFSVLKKRKMLTKTENVEFTPKPIYHLFIIVLNGIDNSINFHYFFTLELGDY